MHSISLVVPSKNSAATLGKLLDSARRNSVAPWELIVVDNHSSDESVQIARRYTEKVFVAGPERSAQRNIGAKLATGEGLLFVDSDMELSEDVVSACGEGLEAFDALCLPETILSGDTYWSMARKYERESYFGSGLFEAPRCVRRSVFEGIGGYSAQITGLEDMDLQARLIEGGFRIGWVREPLKHDERDVSLLQYLKKRARYGITDREFSLRHPELWKQMRSPIIRLRAILRKNANHSLARTLFYLPGILFIRGAESLVRSTTLRPLQKSTR